MSRKYFTDDDIFISRLKMHHEMDFFIYDSRIYMGNQPIISGSHSPNYKNVPVGFISLYEMNINRHTGSLVYPFIERDGELYDLRSNLNSCTGNRPYGNASPGSNTVISSSYPLSSSISRELTISQLYYNNDGLPKYINHKVKALHNIGKRKYATLSKRFILSDGILTSSANLINVPSIFYGSSIKKGSVTLKYFITGSLLASAVDERQNGELVSNYGETSGAVVGLVYYDEGIFLFPTASGYYNEMSFTGSYFQCKNLESDNRGIIFNGSSAASASWLNFGAGANDGITHDASMASASFSMNFLGTTYKNSMTLFCHADKAEFNYSNNPTYLSISDSNYNLFNTSSTSYKEVESPIKNVVSSSYKEHSASFAKTTYITKVGIYDDAGNLIMTTQVARPYKKEEDKDLTFKIKYDLI